DRLRTKLSQTRADAIMATLGPDRIVDIFDFYRRGKLTPDEFNQVADDLTSSGGPTVRGRINVNVAPRTVLECLSGLESADVDKLVAQRSSTGSSGTSTTTSKSIAWVADALGEK